MDIEYIKYIIYGNKERQLLLSYWPPVLMMLIPFITSILTVSSLLTPNPYLTLVSIMPITTLLSLITIVLIYYVIKRWVRLRNIHCKRQLELIGAVISYIRRLVGEEETDLHQDIDGLTHLYLDIKDEEGEMNELLYAIGPIILSLFPIFGYIAFLYVYSMLTADIYLHERREDKILDGFNSLLVKLGFKPLAYTRNKRIPNRSLLLYIILTIVTLGFFMIYWSYAITRDINTHIMENPRWENKLLNVLHTQS